MNRGPPLPHRLLGQTDLPGHDGIGLALGATENDPGSQSQRLGSGWTPLPALEALAFVGEKGAREEWGVRWPW